jgi:hypothetical protein
MTHNERQEILDALFERAELSHYEAEVESVISLILAVSRFYHTQTWEEAGYPAPRGSQDARRAA